MRMNSDICIRQLLHIKGECIYSLGLLEATLTDLFRCWFGTNRTRTNENSNAIICRKMDEASIHYHCFNYPTPTLTILPRLYPDLYWVVSQSLFVFLRKLIAMNHGLREKRLAGTNWIILSVHIQTDSSVWTYNKLSV